MKKSIILILIATIVAGTILIFVTGFNIDVATKAHKEIQINIGVEFKNDEIKQIASEVIGNQVEIQKTGDFEDQAVISAQEITSENIEQIVTKINEKYGQEITADSIETKDIPATRLSDILTPCIWSFAMATVLILVYVALKYKEQGVKKSLAITIACLVIIELLALSLVALFRVPVGKNLTSIIFVAYVLSIFISTTMLENNAKKLKLEESNKDK